MPRPDRPLPGTVTVSPDPAAIGQELTAHGTGIPNDGSNSVWLKWSADPESLGGTLFTGAVLAADGTFASTVRLHFEGEWTLDVFEGFGGPKAKRLASDTFTVMP